MIDERVTVTLPLITDYVIATEFQRVHGIGSVPSAEDIFHPGFDVAAIRAISIAAGPLVPVGGG
eukprot:CAMPEP_0176285004 /NCGR_PEP_ID=MMETSP0121_2-20121125/52143_1 /TAXON_ID=160619 /ORGANISM="Kryptoperidinium foliaceum, Strain CCMP 1326" /LENGTH=63 /DNA_ID=CAMNT_0017625469 /DNA_START=184 /DNA_END=375 /DNA_ORIENTATION=+